MKPAQPTTVTQDRLPAGNVKSLASSEGCTQAEALLSTGQYKEALAQYTRAIESQPDSAEAYIGCGRALTALRQHEYAIAHLDHAVSLAPHNPAAYHYLGVALQKARHFADAIAAYQQAIELQPDNTASFLNLANTLADADYHQEALEFYDALIEEAPSAMAYNNRGNLYFNCKQPELAMADYDRALQLLPDDPKLLWHKALLLLMMGDFAQGWALYEHGFQADGSGRGIRRSFPQPLWTGQTVAGKRILLTAEQGYGDVIQFSRYAEQLIMLGADVVMEVQKPLVNLMRTLHPALTIIEQGQSLPASDFYCPLMSLPLAFKTLVGNIPARVPYLTAEIGLAAKFGLKPSGKLRVGLAWSGSTTHNNDHRRSLPLSLLAPLMSLPVEFHGLQQEVRASDAEQLAAWPQVRMHADTLRDFSDTAALIAAMDIVIAVDTAVVHLAGAMGKPVWILLPFVPDFRWLLDRDDSPWYPTARLYRQNAVGDWPSVIARLQADLATQAGAFNSEMRPV